MKSSYCVMPFLHLEVMNAGDVKPCCVSAGSVRDEDGRPYHVGTNSIEEIWRSREMTELRAAILRGEKPANCSRCWKDESLGIESRRELENRRWTERPTSAAETPKYFDLKLGNLCNLKCRICAVNNSSKFAAEAHQLDPSFDFEKHQRAMNWAEDAESPFWRSMDRALEHIEHFDIYGGEPFLSKTHFELLKKSVELGFSKNQTLHYNTNGTVFPERAIEEIWPHFKNVSVMFSIDGVGPEFEYQRSPAKWAQVESIVRRFQEFDRFQLSVCYTLNAMNVRHFPDFYRWIESRGLSAWVNFLHTPNFMSAQIFSDEMKHETESHLRAQKISRAYLKEIEPIARFLWSGKGSANVRQEFLAYTARLDLARGQKFSEVFPIEYQGVVSGNSQTNSAPAPRSLCTVT